MTAPETYWDDCAACDGRGRDSAEWDDRCAYCSGKGQILVSMPDDDQEDE